MEWKGIYNKNNGELQFEMINGSGTVKEFNYDTGFIFKGEYKNGQRNGKGKEYNYENELIFEGEYLNGKRWKGKE